MSEEPQEPKEKPKCPKCGRQTDWIGKVSGLCIQCSNLPKVVKQ